MLRNLSLLFLLLLIPLSASALTLKLATVVPEGSSWMVQMRDGAKQVEEKTAGRVKIKLYGGGVMGNEKAVLRKIRIGQLQGGAFTSGAMATVAPDLSLYSLPMLFNSLEEVDFVRASMDSMMIKALKDAQFTCFGLAGGGMALMFSKTPIANLADLAGKKVWVPEGDLASYAAMEANGLTPVTLPLTDVLTGLQTGLIDVIGSSPLAAIAFQWHTQVKYFSPTPLSYIFAMLVLDSKVMDKMSSADQQVVSAVFEGIYQRLDKENRQENAQAEEALRKQGLIEEQPLQQLAQMRAATEAALSTRAQEGLFSADRYAEIKALLQKYRSQGKGTK
ncbi:TRAP transporter substrate-binding protein DctP [Geopsychrobacter electrodiphilus]|uniref:TRAP transporter substrate-binding protein n=1 Tax=Geopsychrobacter electrodiphilus TaxID=225196 RepID=UPI000360D97E|nr:TRAP transporter substrate-binding protein DctP [Geopsychrobacter electrodiphilus]